MTLKLKVKSRIPATLRSGVGIKIERAGLVYTTSFDMSALGETAGFDPQQNETLIYNPLTGIYSRLNMASFVAGALQSRVIADPGDVYVEPADGVIVLRKTDAENTVFILPAAADKIGPVKIVDWSGVGESVTISVVPTSPDTIMGLTEWKLGAYSSVVFTPVLGLGYAV